MAKRTGARRYARAVYEIALEAKQLEKWQDDLNIIVGVAGDAAVAAYLESPKIPFGDKQSLLTERMGMVNPLALNLVRLLIVRGRLEMIGEIVSEFQRLLDVHNGIERAQVITAVPVDEKEKQKITVQLEQITGKKLVVSLKEEPELIGGMVARINGKLFDGSTRSRLAALKKEVAGAGK